jgi:hypothetical protein
MIDLCVSVDHLFVWIVVDIAFYCQSLLLLLLLLFVEHRETTSVYKCVLKTRFPMTQYIILFTSAHHMKQKNSD